MKRKDLINYFANDEEGKEEAQRFMSYLEAGKLFAVTKKYTGTRQIYSFRAIGTNYYLYSMHYIFFLCGYRMTADRDIITTGGGRDNAQAAVFYVLDILQESGYNTAAAEEKASNLQRI